MTVDKRNLTHISLVEGEDEEDKVKILESLREADAFLTRQPWCRSVRDLWFGLGVGGLFVVSLAEIENAASPQDDVLWVITGDLPSAYLVTDDLPTPLDALKEYAGLMSSWAEAVLAGRGLHDEYPIDAPATAENARSLIRRIRYLRDNFFG